VDSVLGDMQEMLKKKAMDLVQALAPKSLLNSIETELNGENCYFSNKNFAILETRQSVTLESYGDKWRQKKISKSEAFV